MEKLLKYHIHVYVIHEFKVSILMYQLLSPNY